MIDENRLIEDIKDDAKRILAHVFGEVPSEFIDDYLRQMEWLINKQPKVGEWISYGKKLPEVEKEVLVFTEGNSQRVWNLLDHDDEYVWEDEFGGWNEFEEVLAWMPLPEAYKE